MFPSRRTDHHDARRAGAAKSLRDYLRKYGGGTENAKRWADENVSFADVPDWQDRADIAVVCELYDDNGEPISLDCIASDDDDRLDGFRVEGAPGYIRKAYWERRRKQKEAAPAAE